MSERGKQVGEDFIPEGAENGDPKFMVADGRDSVVMSRIIGMRTALGETVTSPAWRTPDGELLTGPMHAIILMEQGWEDDDYYDFYGAAVAEGWEDGFVTDTGRFVDRSEAAQIMGMNGELESEDLQMAAMRRRAYEIQTFQVGDRVTNLEPGAPPEWADRPMFGPGTVESTDDTPGGEITVRHDNGSVSDGWSSEYTKLTASRRMALNVIVNEGEPGEEWTGSWDEFFQDNLASGGMDEGELNEIRQAIESGQTYQGGGGAAAGWTIRKADKDSALDNAGYGGEFEAMEAADLSGYAPYAEDGNKFDVSEDRAMTPNSHESVEKSLVEDTRMGGRCQSVWLQGIGEWTNVKPADQLQPGDKTVWNYGYVDEVISVVEASEQFVNVVLQSENGETGERRMKKGRLVAVEGSRRRAVQNGDRVRINDPVEDPAFQTAYEDVGIPFEPMTGTVYGEPDERGNIYVQKDQTGDLVPYPIEWLEVIGQRRTADDFEVGEPVESPMGPGEVLDIDQEGQPGEEYTVQDQGGEVSEFDPSALQVMNPEREQAQVASRRVSRHPDHEDDYLDSVYEGNGVRLTTDEMLATLGGARRTAFDDVGFEWDAEDLEHGFESEMEHKDTVREDEDVAEIAIDHLEEDPDYYDKLPLIEGRRTAEIQAGDRVRYTYTGEEGVVDEIRTDEVMHPEIGTVEGEPYATVTMDSGAQYPLSVSVLEKISQRRTADAVDFDDRQTGVLPEDRGPGQADSFILGEPPGGASGFEDLGDSYSPDRGVDGTDVNRMYGGRDWFGQAMQMSRTAGRTRVGGMTSESVLRSIQRYRNVLPMEIVAQFENMLRYYEPDHVMTVFQSRLPELRGLE